MLVPVRSGHFRRDVKRLDKRGKDLGMRRQLLELLLRGEHLPSHYRDHPLRGILSGYRDAHIEPDWLLIYRIVGNELQLARPGSHTDLFNE